ncbi:MAG: VOC family protein [Saprospiraceae bacterium]|nr:VOC family protein [Saprospiraceae bacterium]
MYKLLLLGSLFIGLTSSCSNSGQSNNADTSIHNSSQTTENKSTITQKITPSLWVETKDAKAVADYYLSIFKDGKLKDHRKYKNPPEAGAATLKRRLSKSMD